MFRIVIFVMAMALTLYRKGIENSKWLKYYSKVFNYVEIDSSFYRIPNEFMVKNWYERTPENFRFTAKFPQL